MRTLFFLLVHPTHIITDRRSVSTPLLHLWVLIYASICGLAFQHLYPRLLNQIPWLGFFRKFSPNNWNPQFDLDLFLRGSGMGLVLVTTFTLGLWLFSFATKRRKLKWQQAYLAGIAACIPVLLTSAIAFFFYYLYQPLGLIPIYGGIAATTLNILLLRDLLGVPRSVIVYLAPSIFALQLFLAIELLP